MRRPPLLRSIFVLLVAWQGVANDAAADEPVADEPAAEPAPLTANEQKFAEAMSGASLVGSFTLWKSPGPPKSERYDLGEVRKVGDGMWLIPTRVRYGKQDVTLPITLPVEWAGDTAVIVVDEVGFPGLGTYSARVMIHDGYYAGYWKGGKRGGHLFGELRRGPAPGDPPGP